ncbi:hypothetical protein [Halopseudomonas maritima]|uniref:hypothetical protein n=1 Tax=Halopseudomonas maritima TaxID=2918528 RepID=UPI001EE9E471|nr:hypothetical protein [Halopseudomonas maritima]UJJ30128.1 hypothetical protein HV822_09965 [Halopseudomonas maritima]
MNRRLAALAAVCLLLVACGGHNFEGVYESRAGSDNDLLAAFAELAGGGRIEIGADYIESQGKRTTFDDIFERESAGERYLVFKRGETEEVWRIVDANTLMQGNALVNIKLVRVP